MTYDQGALEVLGTTGLRLSLDATTAATPTARRAVVAALVGTSFETRADEAALAVSELVTNAVLHGRAPIWLEVVVGQDRVRVEVQDQSPLSPTFSMLDPTAVTGRGLVLVGTVVDGWGVEATATGKSVWFVLLDKPTTTSERDETDRLLDAWADDLDGDPALEDVRVVLTDVRTVDLVTSEAHVEGVLRELSLAASDGGDPVRQATAARLLEACAPLDALRVVVRRQLVQALQADRPLVDVQLTVRREDGELVRDFMHAMDDADRLSRQGALLALPAAPEVSATRRAFFTRVLDQLRS